MLKSWRVDFWENGCLEYGFKYFLLFSIKVDKQKQILLLILRYVNVQWPLTTRWQ